jgi:hypothetical protein
MKVELFPGTFRSYVGVGPGVSLGLSPGTQSGLSFHAVEGFRLILNRSSAFAVVLESRQRVVPGTSMYSIAAGVSWAIGKASKIARSDGDPRLRE